MVKDVIEYVKTNHSFQLALAFAIGSVCGSVVSNYIWSDFVTQLIIACK